MGSSPTQGSSFFLGKVTALGVLCCFFLPSFLLISHLNMCIYMCTMKSNNCLDYRGNLISEGACMYAELNSLQTFVMIILSLYLHTVSCVVQLSIWAPQEAALLRPSPPLSLPLPPPPPPPPLRVPMSGVIPAVPPGLHPGAGPFTPARCPI